MSQLWWRLTSLLCLLGRLIATVLFLPIATVYVAAVYCIETLLAPFMAPAKDRPVVMITGASSGIGRAAALHLAEAGCEVFATVRNLQVFEELSTIERMHPVMLDLTKPELIEAALRQVQDYLRSENLELTALVNNAGAAEIGAFEKIPAEKSARVVEVNVIGTMAVTRAFLPLIRASRGRIVNIGSLLAQSPAPAFAPYNASKGAIRAFSLGLREELAPLGVLVSLIEPGPIHTRMSARTIAGFQEVQHQDQTYAGFENLYGPFLRCLFDLLGAEPESSTSLVIEHAVLSRRPQATYAPGRFMFINRVAAALPLSLSPYRFLYQAYCLRKGITDGWIPSRDND